MRAKRLAILVALLAGVAGCAGSPPLPVYPNIDRAAAVRILQQRAAAIRAVSARCAMTMTGGDGQAMRLDALVVIAPPDRMRLRAWKMGQAIFDLTLRPGEIWIESPSKDTLPATAQLARELMWFTGGFFTEPGLLDDGTTDDDLIFRRPLEGGSAMLCQVQRRTLTPRCYRLVDSGGATRFTLDVTDYQDFDGIVWPTHLTATNLRDGSRIDLLLSDLQFNQDLPPRAFIPPPNAEKQP